MVGREIITDLNKYLLECLSVNKFGSNKGVHNFDNYTIIHLFGPQILKGKQNGKGGEIFCFHPCGGLGATFGSI